MSKFGSTIHLVSDLGNIEQLFLYEKTRQLKALQRSTPDSTPPLLCGVTPPTRKTTDVSVHLVFEDESTRTKDSFRNAALWHGAEVSEFSSAVSAFKKETITDIIKMLVNYSPGKQSVFVIRSRLEGVCRWLGDALDKYTKRAGIPRPAFINAGDGRHTHPTLEYVDVFTLLELKSWDRSKVHIALIGDLLNGRTAHSKVDGLRIFENVKVDLIAPSLMAYPVEYVAKMRQHGFEVREFASLEEYMQQDRLADVWYFTRLQLHRLGEAAKGAENELRQAVAFRREWKASLPEGTRFMQTLPRDASAPLVPFEFDSDPVNAWDLNSGNGYWLRVVLLGMITGAMGEELVGLRRVTETPPQMDITPAKLHEEGLVRSGFVESREVEEGKEPKEAMDGAMSIIENGLVVDHIHKGGTLKECWQTIHAIRFVLGWDSLLGVQGVHPTRSAYKGVIIIPNFNLDHLTEPLVKKLAAISPGCTVNIIKSTRVARKYKLLTPPRIYGFHNLACNNTQCVSNPTQGQADVIADFVRVPYYKSSALPAKDVEAVELCRQGGLMIGDDETDSDIPARDLPSKFLFVCRYCMWPHFFNDIWQKQSM